MGQIRLKNTALKLHPVNLKLLWNTMPTDYKQPRRCLATQRMSGIRKSRAIWPSSATTWPDVPHLSHGDWVIPSSWETGSFFTLWLKKSGSIILIAKYGNCSDPSSLKVPRLWWIPFCVRIKWSQRDHSWLVPNLTDKTGSTREHRGFELTLGGLGVKGHHHFWSHSPPSSQCRHAVLWFVP